MVTNSTPVRSARGRAGAGGVFTGHAASGYSEGSSSSRRRCEKSIRGARRRRVTTRSFYQRPARPQALLAALPAVVLRAVVALAVVFSAAVLRAVTRFVVAFLAGARLAVVFLAVAFFAA